MKKGKNKQFLEKGALKNKIFSYITLTGILIGSYFALMAGFSRLNTMVLKYEYEDAEEDQHRPVDYEERIKDIQQEKERSIKATRSTSAISAGAFVIAGGSSVASILSNNSTKKDEEIEYEQ